MALYRPQLSAKRIELTAQLDELPETVILENNNYLEQVLANILSNAANFTSSGTVSVGASCRKLHNDDLHIEISVTDTGIGIPADSMESLFDTFDRTGVKTSGKFGGSGLGLPISKGLVELMGGEIRIESKVGEGTKVTLSFPAEVDPSCSWQPTAEILKVAQAEPLGSSAKTIPTVSWLLRITIPIVKYCACFWQKWAIRLTKLQMANWRSLP